MRRIFQLTALVLALNTTPVWSDQNNPELDALFGLLHESVNATEAAVLTQQIWQN